MKNSLGRKAVAVVNGMEKGNSKEAGRLYAEFSKIYNDVFQTAQNTKEKREIYLIKEKMDEEIRYLTSHY